MSSEEDLFSVYYPDKIVSENEGNGEVFQSATSAEAADDTGENQGNCTSDNQEIHPFVNEQKSQNTAKKTLSEVNTFRRFTKKEMGSKQEITELPAKELNRMLSKFFIHARKRSGDEYEPGSLTGFQRSIQ